MTKTNSVTQVAEDKLAELNKQYVAALEAEKQNPHHMEGTKPTVKAVAILRDRVLMEMVGIYNPSDHSSHFYRFVADRLGDKFLLPEGYNLTIELVMSDARKGTDGYTGRPLHGKFVGLPPMMFALLTMPLFDKEVVTKLFDAEFAEGVLVVREELTEMLEEEDK